VAEGRSLLSATDLIHVGNEGSLQAYAVSHRLDTCWE